MESADMSFPSCGGSLRRSVYLKRHYWLITHHGAHSSLEWAVIIGRHYWCHYFLSNLICEPFGCSPCLTSFAMHPEFSLELSFRRATVDSPASWYSAPCAACSPSRLKRAFSPRTCVRTAKAGGEKSAWTAWFLGALVLHFWEAPIAFVIEVIFG